ncbi:regulatory protein TetR [Ruminiclostridium papyrosolvens DSM 2782]|uniref:Regulatory protein TetR n=1 Tax=Ruminiclostridium papyrosolvens DSM 2782 TaxID=588581 RepID=F1TC35_9FIRM|nr:TetR/AcrR family transcriptional regulator [Ruminiclostridium papyrosolvens]EGD47950.1 regulatory protein TetR [Ruminiclostridium papyrosolvens DSM 2782]WES35158.1 TetR/AcrR family transcriptional regulator [Ruminiclostridium papyrosolvens DSM 2782]
MPKIIENIKENLILEGRETLIDKSYKELNIRDIAKNCGIGIGTFYNYFENKEKFVHEIFMDDWRKIIGLSESLKFSKLPLKEKIREIYIYLDSFVDKYLSIFYEISMQKGYSPERNNDMKDLYISVEGILNIEKDNGTIKSMLTPHSLSQFIVSNLMYLSKTKYISFDELYSHMNI